MEERTVPSYSLPVVIRRVGSSSIQQPAAEFADRPTQFRKMLQKPDVIFSFTVALLLGVPQFGRRLPNSMIGQVNFAPGCKISS